MTNDVAVLLTVFVLYSLGHWIGATLLLIVSLASALLQLCMEVVDKDVLGIERLIRALQRALR